MNTRRPSALPTPKHVCVIGLGNVLMGDDGFGSLAVEKFRCEYECGSNVEILDLGTPGLDLAPYLYGTDVVIIADAVHAHKEEKPGTLCIYCEADLLTQRAQLRLTAHDPDSGVSRAVEAGWSRPLRTYHRRRRSGVVRFWHGHQPHRAEQFLGCSR